MQSQLPVSVIRQPVTKPVMCLTLDVAYICQTAFIVGLNPQRILSPQFETQFLYILTFFHHIIFICMFFMLWILSVSFYLTLLQTIHLHSNAFIFLSVILMHASVVCFCFFCFVFFNHCVSSVSNIECVHVYVVKHLLLRPVHVET